ncbi:RNA-binding protein 7-like [Cloeon dipterum]|uniref:RNA-binding protein 7-like n=1 Tax=Cloeon dipterum TaxID=197152 RepID=UPI00322060A0
MDDERKRSLFVGNLATPATTEALIHELFTQVGPVEKVHIPKNKQTNQPAGYAFVTFKHEVSVMYATQVLAGTQLFGRTLKLQLRDGAGGNTPQQSPSTPRHQQQYQQQPQYQQHQQHRNQQEFNAIYASQKDYRRDHQQNNGYRGDEPYSRDRHNNGRSQDRNRYQERPRDHRNRQQHPYQNNQHQRHGRNRR